MTNRAFTELYPADNETAQYIKALIGLGAVIVGKSKWHRSPLARIQGIGSIYIALSILKATNIRALDQVPLVQLLPLPAILGLITRLERTRSRYNWASLAEFKFALRVSQTYNGGPRGHKEFFPTANEDQQSLLDDYVCVLENYLKTTRTQFSLVERWADCPPEAAEGKSLKDYLGNDYRREYEKEPYVGPRVRFRWDKGASLTMEERDQGKARLAVFCQWFHESVMRQDPDSLSDAILVLPEGQAVPEYRDEAVPFNILEILGENTLAMVLELPHLVLPVGQNSYQSRASGRTEYRPVSASLVGAKGKVKELLPETGDNSPVPRK
ncbi:MAG: hypothetical protein Q9206_007249 [Seirophora lacunosa]